MALPLPSPSLPAKESASGSTTYCRKQKSLGLLCSNFLSLYNRDGVETVGLDEAAARLGVERRRIYDIVNVLESVGVLVRKAKNTYYWKGMGAIPKALEQLKEEGFRNNDETIDCKSGKISDDDEDERFSNHSASFQDKVDLDSMHKVPGSFKSENRKEKSLGLLTKNFLKLFLCTTSDMLSLEDAAKILLGDARNPSLTRTKVRRLYDIANVLSSMNFIEKIHHPETRKPAFRWLGMRGRTDSETGTSNALVHKESKKRTFGTELTNICFKRNKLVSPIDVGINEDIKPLDPQGGSQPVKCNTDRCNSDQVPEQFGPSVPPICLPKSCDEESNEVKKSHDWESLASTYRPQYHNQALRDLFVHYMDAWKSWYSEVAEMDPIQVI
ncbi:E2F transcription factor-like E2FE [Cynara cardunculus var. scolymus]|uniref:E2F transcription factor-like E2FE n=1 Tax=Cynara cardunculus var. scolymus TaxID=59895 RepID=UPI000D62E68E|nr:E2F transcription factor-like E2FE [Cynara cardunculus var. scolymus]